MNLGDTRQETQGNNKTYRDEDGKIQFKEYLLAELTSESRKENATVGIPVEALAKILESITEIKENNLKIR